jgi:hypothetical protein
VSFAEGQKIVCLRSQSKEVPHFGAKSNNMKIFSLPSTVLLIAFSFFVSTSALAGKPSKTPINVTVIDPALGAICGFAVEVHVQGTLVESQIGSRTLTRGVKYQVTFRNVESGKNFVLHVSGLQENGPTFQRFSGTSLRIVVPGRIVLLDSGRLVLEFNPLTGEASVLMDTGRNDTLPADLICELLS